MRGPENLCVNDDLGLLIEGFDTPPMIMMPHNPPYYERLLEQCGFAKAMDLFAYYGDSTGIPERVAKARDELARRRNRFIVRSLRMNDFDAELKKIHHIYTSAWEENWGAVAMTDREFDHLANDLKRVVDPDFCLIAEVDGEVAGFSLALPDFNQVLIRLNGRLFPLGLFKMLYFKRRIDAVRVLTMGVIKKFRSMGIDNCFYYETHIRAMARGMWHVEMSWVLENNILMNRTLQNLGFRSKKNTVCMIFPFNSRCAKFW